MASARPRSERRAPVGGIDLEAVERGARALDVVLEEARLGAPERDVLVLPIGEALEPELGARAVAVREIEIGEPEERLASRVAARLGDGERAHERVARLLGRRADALARAAEAHPDLAARRDAPGELLERERELGIEARRLARVGEEREPERRVRARG